MPQQGNDKVTVNVDPEVLAWFKAQGPKFEDEINIALRSYIEAHRGEDL